MKLRINHGRYKEDLTALYYDVDKFIKKISDNSNKQITTELYKGMRGPERKISLSEIITIVIFDHASKFKHFKAFYLYLKNQSPPSQT